jgi:transposase
MTIYVRSITPEESETLDHWERADDVVGYRRARILRLSEAGWQAGRIANALGLHIETVRQTIKDFNKGGIPAIAPRPRSGGSQPVYTDEVAEAAETLVRQKPPPEQDRATWTLVSLSEVLAARFDHIGAMSHEAVRRLLNQRGITYRRAKEWLISPDPLYDVRKNQRDRLLAMARAAPDGAAIWLDQSWFVRWPYQFWAWATKDDVPHVAKRWNEDVDTTALYAALDDETQEAFLRWAEGQPNSEVTVGFLEALMAHWNTQDKRFIVLIWDKASWHTSNQTTQWIRDYNRRAKQEGLTRLITCLLPTRSPWLMPLESVFGWIKHQILGDRFFKAIAELQAAVERCFRRRVARAKMRRDKSWASVVQNSRSVV